MCDAWNQAAQRIQRVRDELNGHRERDECIREALGAGNGDPGHERAGPDGMAQGSGRG